MCANIFPDSYTQSECMDQVATNDIFRQTIYLKQCLKVPGFQIHTLEFSAWIGKTAH